MAHAVLMRRAMAPSQQHEVIVELLRDAELVRTLLAVGGVAVVGAPHAADTALTAPEIRADVVFVFGEPPERLAVVVEVQRNRDNDKKWTWPLYEAAARARHRCDACVLVFATDALVAAWARAPIRLGPASSFRAIVIGPREVPVVREADARAFSSLAILSAIARAHTDDALEAARAALTALETMHPDRARVYLDLILERLDGAARRALEEWMDFDNYVFTSDWAKRALAKAKAELEAEGRAAGKAEGKAEGELVGARQALFEVLGARGLTVDDDARARIQACREIATLRRWVARAVVVESIAAMFARA